MKKIIITLIAALSAAISFSQSAECGGANATPAIKPEKIGIIIYSNDAETVWNAFRLANYAQDQGDTISVFLLGKGVEAEKISTNDFDIKGLMNDLDTGGGKIYACGTCLQLRSQEGTHLCPVSTLSDLYDIIKTNKKILTF